MLKIDNDILTESISEVLEKMAFMMLMPPEEPLPNPEQSIRATICFSGVVSGQINLLAGNELIEMMAANFMGVEPDDPEANEKRTDAFKEILNTVCGVLLPKLASSPADVFDITIPEAHEINTQEEWDTLIKENDAVIMDCDFNPLAFWISEA